MSLSVRSVQGRRGTADFVDVAWRVQAGRGTAWIPPLRVMVRDALDTRKNPFYRNAERELFIAERDGVRVGRIAAIENGNHNDYHGDRTGFFGFFECVDDPEAARGLVDAARDWLAARGLETIRGPMNPSMHNDLGVLVDGFDLDPVLTMPWNPPYYDSLLQGTGLKGVRDLLAYFLESGAEQTMPERLRRLAERQKRRSRLTFRRWDFGTFEQEARLVHRLYCASWEGNWGFTPPSWDEFWHLAKDLKALLHPDFTFVGEVDGEPVGFVMIARDLNRVLRKIPSGRLWPWNIARLLFGVRSVRQGRFVLLGLTPEYRRRGYFSMFAAEVARRAAAAGAEGAEASWVLEENEALIAPLAAMGLEPNKRWRIYEGGVR